MRNAGVALITIGQMKELAHNRAWGIHSRRNELELRLFQEELRDLVANAMRAVAIASGLQARRVLITNERMVGARMPGTADSSTFRPLAEVSIAEILDTLRPRRTHLALYTRRQDRLMESCYLWEVQKGVSHSLSDQFPYLDRPALGYSSLIRRLEDLTGIDTIRVRPFELIHRGSLRFINDFLVNLDLADQLDLSVFKKDPAANLSYSQRALDLALNMNPLLDTTEQRNATRRFLKRQFPADRYPAARILSDEERLKVIDLYREDNEHIFRAHMADLPSDTYSSEAATSKLGTQPSGVKP